MKSSTVLFHKDDLLKMRNYIFFPLLNLIILCVFNFAHAASFNCNQASRPKEKSIYQNEDLSIPYDVLAKAYQEHVKVLSKDAQSLAQASQRSWLTCWSQYLYSMRIWIYSAKDCR